MTIDTKRLKTDAAYWDEVAGTATHYCPSNRQFYDCRLHPCCIPRPTKPAAPEWNGEGLPPVGCKCEFRCNECGWRVVKVRYISKNGAVVDLLDGSEAFVSERQNPEFRPFAQPSSGRGMRFSI